jgi:hypothetical protein
MASDNRVAARCPAEGATNVKQKPMDGAQMQDALDVIGFSQVGFAKTVGYNDRSVRLWIAGKYPVPRIVAMLLNLMIDTDSTEEDLRA